MNSAIRYILKIKNMRQSELICDGMSKQTVFKYISGERRIRGNIVSKWKEILQVPEYYWLNDNGYCKDINKSEEIDISKYLINKIDLRDKYVKNKVYAIKYVKTYEEIYIVNAESYDDAVKLVDYSIRSGFIEEPKKCISSEFIDSTYKVKRKDGYTKVNV